MTVPQAQMEARASPLRSVFARIWATFDTREVHAVVATAALFGMALFLVWVAIPWIMLGVSSADDAYFAEAAKSFAIGRGYGEPITSDLFRLFDPSMGTGPALILPLAALVRIFGPSDYLPGATSLAILMGQMGITGVVLARRFGRVPTVALLAGLIFTLMIFTRGFYILGTFLGEPATFGFLLIGAAFLAVSDDRWGIAAGGIALSLAVLTKQVAVFSVAGIVVAWVAVTVMSGLDRGQVLRRVGLLLAAAATLPVMFELVKLVSLGPGAYITVTLQALAFAKASAGSASPQPVATLQTVLQTNYQPPIVILAFALASALALFALRRRGVPIGRAAGLSAMLWAGAAGQLAYFLFSSSDWPRYLWIAIALTCAAGVVPFLVVPARARTTVIVSFAAATLLFGWYRPLVGVHDHVPRPTAHADRMAVATFLDAHPNLPYAAVKWSSLFDVLYVRPDEGRWVQASNIGELRGSEFVVLVNHAFTDEYVSSSRMYQTMSGECSVAFDTETIGAYLCSDAFWAAYFVVPNADTSDGSIDPLTSVAAYQAGANTTLSVVADAPPEAAGNSFMASIAGLGAGTTSVNLRAVALDLSGFGDAATFRLWVKSSSLTNLDGVYLTFWSSSGWVVYDTMPATAGAWQEFVLEKGSPISSSETIDWSDIAGIALQAHASAAGPYTGDVLWRGLRISQ